MKVYINAYQHLYLKGPNFQEIWKSQNLKIFTFKKKCHYFCTGVYVSVSVSVNHRFDKKYKTPCLRSLIFWGFIDFDLQGQINSKVKIYPILSFWVCPWDMSIQVEVRLSTFGPKMHLSTFKVPIDFDTDWPWSLVFIFNFKPATFYQTLRLIHLRRFVYI